MMWIAASSGGVAIAFFHCASLWLAIARGTREGAVRTTLGRAAVPFDTGNALRWFALASLARLAFVGALFCVLVQLGAQVALWGLVGFALAHTASVYAIGGIAHAK
ncbi:MAG TPA: hypothetical protein VHC22_16465 [Pirellulales bacterium]|nr:hypothetical protein [Pirellulales bacterium]